MSAYKDGPSICPKCGAPTHYTASTDTESQGYFGTHRYDASERDRLAASVEKLREALQPFASYARGLEPTNASDSIAIGICPRKDGGSDGPTGVWEKTDGGASLGDCFRAQRVLAETQPAEPEGRTT